MENKSATPRRTPPVMILCGGRGTRLKDVTELLPKPMVPVGEYPMVWHVMKCFAAFGVRRFILCLGYKREAFADYFLNYQVRTQDATLTLGDRNHVTIHSANREADWQVTLAGTGVESQTGCRVFRAAKYLAPDDEHFFLAYGDSLADIDLNAVYQRHLSGGKLLTISGVHPEGRFGEIRLSGDLATGFEEKPPQLAGYVNGGFMAVDRNFVTRYLADDEALSFEREPMQAAARDRQMQVVCHEGFWQCMDNPREYALLNDLWRRGSAPWTKFWN